ncbi:Histidine triad nucleotide-binding (HIT-like) protein [Mycoplasmopsis citelli]|uniref:Histidine triad nucleotide-binding (HIT-like) protein n=1 Tax=Mycoplasmopsis citelli TaxID=171281 RepID=A0A449B2H9_9BACT|nr:HIT family protein [Mycoplasmopsis citelli]VEU74734.1 Histidine triad nucleotide-binding (HIT-like) protein [Mycoplasmopsis citelli]
MLNKSVFSKILDKELPATFIYEDDVVFSIMDAYPFREGHFLVIPKSPEPNILENDEATFLHAMKIARKLAKERVIDQGIPGFKIVINTGEYAGQTVFHSHVHVIPFKVKIESTKITP